MDVQIQQLYAGYHEQQQVPRRGRNPKVTPMRSSSRSGQRVSYVEEFDPELDSEPEDQARAPKVETVPAFIESTETLDDEVERVLTHRSALPLCPPPPLFPLHLLPPSMARLVGDVFAFV